MNKLKEIRTKKGLTQIDLAYASGISIQNIKRMECENFDFNKSKLETLKKLANGLNIKVDYFIK